MKDEKNFKSGFASMIGRPNVGKSTLINCLIGQKVAIVSEKAQTTRHKITSVITKDDAQVILLDTPGVHKPKHKLGEGLVEIALNALEEVDLVLFMVEALSPGAGDNYILEQLKKIKTPVILVINKIDSLKKEDLLPLILEYSNWYDFKEIVPVSAITGENVDKLLEVIKGYLPYGPQYYPDGMITDRPENFIMAELIREKVLHFTLKEVPHSVAVVVENVSKRDNGIVDIFATVYTERESQKGILIGKGGQMMKKIGQESRQEMEKLLGSKIFLQLRVKVKSDWRNREDLIHRFGYCNE